MQRLALKEWKSKDRKKDVISAPSEVTTILIFSIDCFSLLWFFHLFNKHLWSISSVPAAGCGNTDSPCPHGDALRNDSPEGKIG